MVIKQYRITAVRYISGIGFVDLNTVEWAYEAIMALADNGIVNGKTDNEFYPNDKVTREEFAKLLVCMARLENSAITSDAIFGQILFLM